MGIEPTQPVWETGILPLNYICKSRHMIAFGDTYGGRTHVSAVKGRCLNLLTKVPNIGGQSRNRTYDVSYVPDLQSGVFANYTYLPILKISVYFRSATVLLFCI